MKKKYFGTDGIRGQVNQFPIRPDFIFKLSFSLSEYLAKVNGTKSKKKVLIGKDTRASCKMIESSLVSGFTAAGVDCITIGEVPTPLVSFLTRDLSCELGIMISASHNPYTDNGVKIFKSDGTKLTDFEELEIEKILEHTSDLNFCDASKIGADAMAMSFFNAFELPVTIARPFNTYGPRQSARAVIPTIIAQIATGMKEIKLGDVSPTRDFNYVEDTCRGFIALAETERTIGETVNIGSNFEISIGDILNIIKELMGSDVQFITDDQRIRPENSEVFRLWCDNTHIEKLTGFKSQVDIRQGLQRTIDWFILEGNLTKYKATIYNV